MDPRTVLSRDIIEVCRTLGQSQLVSSFYLAGGTGLALQLGHRKSDDLDFFPRDAEETIATGVIAVSAGVKGLLKKSLSSDVGLGCCQIGPQG